jgi:hypothetical protein
MDICNLSDKLELDDNVIVVYRKSLVSLSVDSYEEDPQPAPLLGKQIHAKGLH